jgi:hypothetical protein
MSISEQALVLLHFKDDMSKVCHHTNLDGIA